MNDEVLAGYLDDALSTSERARVDAHLAQCEACRADLVQSRRLLASLAPEATRPRRLRQLAPLAAIAATLLLLLPGRDAREAMTPPLRDPTPPAAGRPVALEPVRPADGIRLPGVPKTFDWRPAGASATYRLTLSDASGRAVWSITQDDTVAVVPSALSLPSGRYFWYVDAQRLDGLSTSSPVRTFILE